MTLPYKDDQKNTLTELQKKSIYQCICTWDTVFIFVGCECFAGMKGQQDSKTIFSSAHFDWPNSKWLGLSTFRCYGWHIEVCKDSAKNEILVF